MTFNTINTWMLTENPQEGRKRHFKTASRTEY